MAEKHASESNFLLVKRAGRMLSWADNLFRSDYSPELLLDHSVEAFRKRAPR